MSSWRSALAVERFMDPLSQARDTGAAVDPRCAPTLEEVSFARRVRKAGWSSCAPLIGTLAFGAALLFTSAAAPPSATVRRLLANEETRALFNAQAELIRRDGGYRLPTHWQWPSLSTAPDGSAELACAGKPADAPC